MYSECAFFPINFVKYLQTQDITPFSYSAMRNMQEKKGKKVHL